MVTGRARPCLRPGTIYVGHRASMIQKAARARRRNYRLRCPDSPIPCIEDLVAASRSRSATFGANPTLSVLSRFSEPHSDCEDVDTTMTNAGSDAFYRASPNHDLYRWDAAWNRWRVADRGTADSDDLGCACASLHGEKAVAQKSNLPQRVVSVRSNSSSRSRTCGAGATTRWS